MSVSVLCVCLRGTRGSRHLRRIENKEKRARDSHRHRDRMARLRGMAMLFVGLAYLLRAAPSLAAQDGQPPEQHVQQHTGKHTGTLPIVYSSTTSPIYINTSACFFLSFLGRTKGGYTRAPPGQFATRFYT